MGTESLQRLDCHIAILPKNNVSCKLLALTGALYVMVCYSFELEAMEEHLKALEGVVARLETLSGAKLEVSPTKAGEQGVEKLVAKLSLITTRIESKAV